MADNASWNKNKIQDNIYSVFFKDSKFIGLYRKTISLNFTINI